MIDYGEPTILYSEKEYKARKSHTCGECGREISKGEKYIKCSGLTDGSWWSGKQCVQCTSAASLLMDYCGGYIVGGVLEDLEDHIHETLPWSMQAARCVVAMKRHWQRFDKSGLMQ